MVGTVLGPFLGDEKGGARRNRDVTFAIGSMVRQMCLSLPQNAGPPLLAAGDRLSVRATGVMLDDEFVDLTPTQLAMLRALVARPGHVLTRVESAHAMPGPGDESAVEMAITRLRSALRDPSIVQTVVKRGYRLAVDPG